MVQQQGKLAFREDPKNYLQHMNLFNTEGLTFPLKGPDEIQKFCSMNSGLDFDLTVYKLFNNDIHPVFTTHENRDVPMQCHHFQVLEIEGCIKPTEEEPNFEYASHYILIENVDAFMQKQYNYVKEGKTTTSSNGVNVCPLCEVYKTCTASAMKKHRTGCD
jgi:hypothetical protein